MMRLRTRFTAAVTISKLVTHSCFAALSRSSMALRLLISPAETKSRALIVAWFADAALAYRLSAKACEPDHSGQKSSW